MNLEILRLLFDFGMVVLIWLVQLVIYPGLCYYTNQDITIWHQKYTPRISYVVMPLMIGQLVLVVLEVISTPNLYSLISLGLLLLLWTITFTQFVPLHAKLSQSEDCANIPHKLVRLNWIRTLLWTLLFLWSFCWLLITQSSMGF